MKTCAASTLEKGLASNLAGVKRVYETPRTILAYALRPTYASGLMLQCKTHDFGWPGPGETHRWR